MQKIISKYAVAAHLSLLAVSPLFLFPWCGAEVVTTVLAWLSGLALMWIVLEPSRRSDEMLHEARARVFMELLRDPLFWVFIVLALVAFLRWMNDGVEMTYDAENAFWHMTEPAAAYLPAAMPGRGGLEFMVVLAACVLVSGCRHAMGRSARLSFMFTSSFLAGIAAIVLALAGFFGVKEVVAAESASFVTPYFIGTVFGIYLLTAIVAVAGAVEDGWGRGIILSAFSIGGTGAGLYLFAPTVVALLFAAAAVLTLFCCMIWTGAKVRGAAPLICFVSLFVGVVLAVFIVVCCEPEGLSAARLELVSSGALLPDGFWELRTRLSDISLKVWKNAQWFGTGLGSFPLDIRFNAVPDDWLVIHTRQSAATNGWWTLLVERGIAGAVMLALPLVFLLFTFLRRIPASFGKRVFFPAAWLGILVALVVVAETFIDVSFLRPEAILILGALFSLAAGAMPPVKPKERKQETEK